MQFGREYQPTHGLPHCIWGGGGGKMYTFVMDERADLGQN